MEVDFETNQQMTKKHTNLNFPFGIEKQIIYIYSTKKVKEISENHGTKEHQNKQFFNFYLFV